MNRGLMGAFLVAGLLGSGCGSSSSGNSDGVAEGFMGTWELDGTNTSFTLTCPNTQAIGTLLFPIWTELDLDHGVLAPLTDVSNACVPPGMSFDVDSGGITASVVTPDPYSGGPALCRFSLGSDSYGVPAYIDFSFSSLTITKLPDSGSGKAPRVLFGGSAMGPLMMGDQTVQDNLVMTDTCTYMNYVGGGDIFHRTTQP